MRSARVPLLYPCRYARENLSVREIDRRCPPLAFCPKRISVGRAHHHRKRMHSIRRFRKKLTFRRNILLYISVILGRARRAGPGGHGLPGGEQPWKLQILVYSVEGK